MLDDAQQVLRQARRNVANFPAQLDGGKMAVSESPETEEVGVHIGDVIQHLQPAKPPVLGPLLRAAALAIGVATPLGAALALAPAIMGMLTRPADVRPQTEAPSIRVDGKEYALGLMQDDEVERP